jgi:hypothetical protein
VPAADFLEFDGEAGEGGVEDAVAEAGVEGDEEANGREEELEGADEVFVPEFGEGDVPFFVFGVEGTVACLAYQFWIELRRE